MIPDTTLANTSICLGITISAEICQLMIKYAKQHDRFYSVQARLYFIFQLAVSY